MEREVDRLRKFSREHNLKLSVLYTYNLTSQPKSKAVRFVYCLKGRGKEKGIVEEYKGEWLARGCFIIPVEKDDELKIIFEHWKIPFKRRMILTYPHSRSGMSKTRGF